MQNTKSKNVQIQKYKKGKNNYKNIQKVKYKVNTKISIQKYKICIDTHTHTPIITHTYHHRTHTYHHQPQDHRQSQSLRQYPTRYWTPHWGHHRDAGVYGR